MTFKVKNLFARLTGHCILDNWQLWTFSEVKSLGGGSWSIFLRSLTWTSWVKSRVQLDPRTWKGGLTDWRQPIARMTRMAKVAKVITRMANVFRMAQVIRRNWMVSPFRWQKSPSITAQPWPGAPGFRIGYESLSKTEVTIAWGQLRGGGRVPEGLLLDLRLVTLTGSQLNYLHSASAPWTAALPQQYAEPDLSTDIVGLM